jgi:transcriptional regulator with XRE-family HTH domain
VNGPESVRQIEYSYGMVNMDTRRTPPIDAIAAAIRRERERVGISLSELAKRAGVAKSTLSQLEAGTGNPSVETLWALGVALDVPFSRLVEPRTTPMVVIRAGDGPGIPSSQGDFTGILLAACPPGARRDIYMITAEPGSVRSADPHLPGSVEHLVVISGRLRTGTGARTEDLDPGDYVRFAGDVPHRYEALAPGTAAVLVMEHV